MICGGVQVSRRLNSTELYVKVEAYQKKRAFESIVMRKMSHFHLILSYFEVRHDDVHIFFGPTIEFGLFVIRTILLFVLSANFFFFALPIHVACVCNICSR